MTSLAAIPPLPADLIEGLILADLSEAQVAALELALTPDIGPWVPYRPTPKQTAAFLLEDVLEVGYGGAAGGAKSWWLLGEALRHVDKPGYGVLILRNTLPDLTAEPNGLIPTLRRWLLPHLDAKRVKWAGSTRTWHFPSGATISFGYLQDQAGERYRKYAGPSWHCICIDQAEQFRPEHYRFMFSRLRSAIGTPYPIRFRSTFNPGGPAHDFLVERFNLLADYPDPLKCTHCGQPWRGHDSTEHMFSNRAFMPSFLDDNPHLDASYERSLMELGDVEYQRLRYGNFAITTSGALFKVQLFGAAVTGPPEATRVRAWDLAATEATEGHDPDYTVGVLMARLGRVEWVEDVVRGRWTPDDVDRQMSETAARDGKAIPIAVEQEGRSAGAREIAAIRRNLRGHRIIGVLPVGTKLQRAGQYARWVNQGKDPASSSDPERMATFSVNLCAGEWVPGYISELRNFKGDNRGHDDQVDASAIGHNYLDKYAPRAGWVPQSEQLATAATRVPPPPD